MNARLHGVELAAGAFRRAPVFRGKAAAGLRLQRAVLGEEAAGVVLPVRMKDGSVMRLDLGSPTERPSVWTGRYEPHLLDFLLDVVRPGWHVIDVGANVGFYAVALGRRLRESGGQIYAFEPVAANAERLRENLALNGLAETVKVFRLALGEQPGTVELRLEDGAGTGNAVAFPPGESGRPDDVARLDTLDAVAARERIPACHLLKLDVEGYELAVLRGARHVLAEHRPLVLAELNAHWMARFGWSLEDLEAFALAHAYLLRRLDGHALLIPEEAA